MIEAEREAAQEVCDAWTCLGEAQSVSELAAGYRRMAVAVSVLRAVLTGEDQNVETDCGG